ncbi:hypothetical protein [Citricoccus zhacaiensis]|uniref:hypothetical protein n=1 Tax=Citricoccus zhacaiensis TaxID=489142 RepID=UPI00166DB0E0|nr:hypothetical protein [Citricoccus zhacaiensis]
MMSMLRSTPNSPLPRAGRSELRPTPDAAAEALTPSWRDQRSADPTVQRVLRAGVVGGGPGLR